MKRGDEEKIEEESGSKPQGPPFSTMRSSAVVGRRTASPSAVLYVSFVVGSGAEGERAEEPLTRTGEIGPAGTVDGL